MRRLLRRIGNRMRPARLQPLILMYHRVAAPVVDPWGLAVHPDRFAAHMEVPAGEHGRLSECRSSCGVFSTERCQSTQLA